VGMPEIIVALSCLRRSFLNSNHRFFPSNLPNRLAPNFTTRIPRNTFLQPRTMATLGAYQKKHKVAIVGSGNWYVDSNPF
jgi:hypothetical protein